MTKEIVRKTNRTPTRREKKYLPLDITITKSPNVIDSNGNGMQMEQNSNPRVVMYVKIKQERTISLFLLI